MKYAVRAEGALQVISHPAIYALISDDSSPDVHEFALPEDAQSLVFWDDFAVGAVVCRPLSGICLDVHIQVLPQYRDDALEMACHARDLLFEAGWEKLTAQIPFCHENVKVFAEKVGFVEEGVNERSIVKGGVHYDQWYMGLSKWDLQPE